MYCEGKKQGLRGRKNMGWNHVPDIHAIQQILSAYVVPAAVPVLLLQ